MSKNLTYKTIFEKEIDVQNSILNQRSVYSRIPLKTRGAKTLQQKLNKIYYGKNHTDSIFYKNIDAIISKKFGDIMTSSYGVNTQGLFLASDASAEQIRDKIRILMNQLQGSKSEEEMLKYNQMFTEIEAQIQVANNNIQVEGGNKIQNNPNKGLIDQLNTLTKNFELSAIGRKAGYIFEISRKIADEYADKELAEEEIEKIINSSLPGAQYTAKTQGLMKKSKKVKIDNMEATFNIFSKEKKITTKIDYTSTYGNESLKNLSSLKGQTRLQGDYLHSSGTALYGFLANPLFQNDFTIQYLRQTVTGNQNNYQDIVETVKIGLFIIALTGIGQEMGKQKIDYFIINNRKGGKDRTGEIIVKNTKDLVNYMLQNSEGVNQIIVPKAIFTQQKLETLLDIKTHVSIKNLQKIFNMLKT